MSRIANDAQHVKQNRFMRDARKSMAAKRPLAAPFCPRANRCSIREYLASLSGLL